MRKIILGLSILFLSGISFLKASTVTAAPCLITLFGQQFDVTSLQTSHTGGNLFVCGTDMTSTYLAQHGTDLSRMQPYLVTPTPTPTPTGTPTPTVSPSPTASPDPSASPETEEIEDDDDDNDNFEEEDEEENDDEEEHENDEERNENRQIHVEERSED